jgi:hypothetical protein
LKECEQIFGFMFPAAVREWYLLSNSQQILTEFSNDDYPMALEDMMEAHTQQQSYSHFAIDLTKPMMLPFLWENQAVFVCAVKLDGSDDPPVSVWDDDGEWKLWAEHFSSFISRWVWNFLYFRSYYETSLRASEPTFIESDMNFLRKHFNEQPPKSSHSTVHHFSVRDEHVHLWRENTSSFHWWLRAETKESLLNLARTLWQCGTLAKTLTIQGSYIHNDAGKVLEILRFGKELPEK